MGGMVDNMLQAVEDSWVFLWQVRLCDWFLSIDRYGERSGDQPEWWLRTSFGTLCIFCISAVPTVTLILGLWYAQQGSSV